MKRKASPLGALVLIFLFNFLVNAAYAQNRAPMLPVSIILPVPR